MVFSDLMKTLKDEGFEVTETMVRWAIKSGKVSRPALDGSQRFVFDKEHVKAFRRHFKQCDADKAAKASKKKASQDAV